jgi:hypothetical protein
MRLEDLKKGDRVKIHPATDAWMRGLRFGVVVTVGRKWVKVVFREHAITQKFAPENIWDVVQ